MKTPWIIRLTGESEVNRFRHMPEVVQSEIISTDAGIYENSYVVEYSTESGEQLEANIKVKIDSAKMPQAAMKLKRSK
jgi:hypothetical protein